MASHSDKLTRFRIVDLETAGTTPNDAVVEIGAVDLIGGKIIFIGFDLVRPPVPIPPQASAIHQITDENVGACPRLEEILPMYGRRSSGGGRRVRRSQLGVRGLG